MILSSKELINRSKKPRKGFYVMNTTDDNSPYWGYHLSIDAGGADIKKISDPDLIYAFIKDLVTRIDMVPYGEPQIVRFGSGNKLGITAMQLIETSNICVHFVEYDPKNTGLGSYYFDCFSCKPYDVNEVVNCCREYFGNAAERIHYFVRQAD